MGGRRAIFWTAITAAVLAANGPAADPPVPVPTVPIAPIPPLPGQPPSVNQPPSVKLPTTESVSAYQPPEPPSVRPNNEPPAQPFREPPGNPFLPQQPFTPEVILPNGGRVTLPAAVRQQIRFSPRYGGGVNYQSEKLDERTDRWVITGGIIVSVVYYSGEPGLPGVRLQEVEFATDRVVAWVKGASGKNIQSGLEGGEGKTEVELYMAGNVVIRQFSPDGFANRPVEQVLRAKEIYYDVSRNRAIALAGDLELKADRLPESVHLAGREVWQLGPDEWQAFDTDTFSSKRPSDPNLIFAARRSGLTRQQDTVRRNVFGLPYRDLLTGQPVVGTEQILTNERVVIRLAGLPIFYLPRTETDINEPIGPLAGFSIGNDRIFGFQAYTTWDLFKLAGLRGPPGHRWVLYADYLSLRGPGFGTQYDYNGRDLFRLAGPVVDPATGRRERPEWDQPFYGFARAYVVSDKGSDVLGGDRGPIAGHPDLRSRFQWRQNGDIYESGTTYLRAMAQAEYLSDTNFLEQYYKFEFDSQPNQETFLYLPGAIGNAYGSLLLEKNVARPWVTETQSLPRADGYLIGQSLLDTFTYSAHASGGYYQFVPGNPTLQPPPVTVTDSRAIDTGRFDLNQRLGMPVDLGPFRAEPYGVVDLAYYTEDLNGNGRGRFYGGGGTKLSTTLSRLYPDIASELFNVNGLYHKVTFGANYFAAYSDTPYTQLPQLDRLNDDATDIAYRTAVNAYRNSANAYAANPAGTTPLISPQADQALGYSPIFDLQRLAIRKLTPDRVDTLDSIQVLQLGINQRWQTKRGFPGSEHIIDWLTLDLSMSVFPDKDRDNFGKATAFYEYNVLWHVGDRTSLGSAGWYDPFDTGARYFNVGAYFNRPDGSNFALIYRHTDPVDSRALTGVVSYPLSRKYSVNLISTYDFGTTKNQSTQVSFARTGTDLTVLFGLSYNALVNNLGVQFAVVPNLAGITGAGLAGVNNQLFGGGGGLRQR